jgi:nicotinate-nucleotide adenylyltransferase
VKVGILGGTFDPIHIGHLIVAEEARTRLGLKEVLFVPAGQPWLKLDRDVSPAVQRVEMVRRAIADNPHFRVSVIEVERTGHSYTVDTLTALHQQMGSEASLFFLLGRDALAELHLWKEPQRVVRLCRLVVAPRPVLSDTGTPSSDDLVHLQTAIPGLLDRVIELDMPVIGISSSGVRQRVAGGLSIRYLVPPGVAAYIAEQKMYLPAAL